MTYGNLILLAAMKMNPLVRQMPAVRNDSIVMLKNDPLGNAANPTPLGLPWVLDDYVALLAEAAASSQ